VAQKIGNARNLVTADGTCQGTPEMIRRALAEKNLSILFGGSWQQSRPRLMLPLAPHLAVMGHPANRKIMEPSYFPPGRFDSRLSTSAHLHRTEADAHAVMEAWR